ncbi:MAG TPA: chromosomal replication initiator protein DnaA [Candidatus Brocadiia bacterium]|nr:chromosomal replication initiator protein DnaA [Candidatus Brocadiia bacterium]
MSTPLSVAKQQAWPAVLEDIKAEIGDRRYNLWLGHIELIRFDEERVEIGVPNLFIQEWLEKHFRGLVEKACATRLGASPEIKFVIAGKLFRDSREKARQTEAEIVVQGAREGRQGAANNINPDFRMDTFVQGPCNRLGYACAQELIQGNGGAFRPLFIHSDSGLGKTHLLQAVWWAMHDSGSGRRAEYVPAEEFTNQFIYAMRRGKLDAFRSKYRKVDVLLIDDVHFFAEKRSLQEEFLHTYDALVGEDKQVVLASDVHPKLLKEFKESLVSRFASGMVVGLGRPNQAMRVEILRSRALRAGKTLDDSVLEFLAGHFDGSIRELCGVLMTVIAYASLARRRVDVSLAREALAGISHARPAALDLALIERVVSERFGVSQKDLHSGRRTKAIALPRQICMYLARELTQSPCVDISRHFGGKHHTTAVFSHRRVAELCRADRDLSERVADIREQLLKMAPR